MPGLAGLPALLGRVTLEEAERGQSGAAAGEGPPARLLDSMLTQMAGQRSARRRRSVLLAVAASVVVLAGGGAGAAVLVSATRTAQPAHHVAVGPVWDKASGHDVATNVRASVMYRPRTWGTEMSVWVSGVPVGTTCQLWVVDHSGRRMVAGGWQVPQNEQAIWYPGSAPVAAASIGSFQITSQGRTLVTMSS